MTVVSVIVLGELSKLFLECLANERCQIEVECRDGLATVHFVLNGLHRDAGKHAGGLDTLGRSALAVTRLKAVLKHYVQWVLDTGQALSRIIVLIVNVNIASGDRFPYVLGEQALVDIGLRGFRSELHHHTGRSVGIARR